MDKIVYYQQCIKKILSTYQSINNRYPTIQTQILIDDEHGHYYVMRVGWQDKRRVHYCVFHFDLIGDKIWVQRNQTDWDLSVDFEDMNIPKSDIVLGFLSPEQRAMSSYAVE